MAEAREIDVEIDLESDFVKMETINFKGKSCEEMLDAFEKFLGAKTVSKTSKKEKLLKETLPIKQKQQHQKI